jgi:hypothetical protein
LEVLITYSITTYGTTAYSTTNCSFNTGIHSS